MARTRRILTRGGDGSSFDDPAVQEQFRFDGEFWEQDTSLDLSVVAHQVVDLPFALQFGDSQVTRIVIWEDGFISLGDVTQAQIDWVAANPPPASLFDFPGEYISAGRIDVESDVQNVRYAAGKIDFQADPNAEAPYSVEDAVDIFRITWGSPNFSSFQIQLTPEDFAIVDLSVTSPEEEPGEIGFKIDGYAFDPRFQPMAEYFFYDGLGGAYLGDRFANVIGGTGRGDLLRGQGGNDQLYGNDGDDTLHGGLGVDRMTGGLGNDRFIVDHANDKAIEGVGGGLDRVLASRSHSLGANVEELQLTGGAAINGNGNGLDNLIIGNGASNRIDGRGGADVMRGGGGNDVYRVNLAGEAIEETAAGGVDRVISTADHVLAANVENLILGGSGDIDGFGNALDNAILGNAGDNRLVGSFGRDRLTGGLGSDRFAFNTPPEVADNVDQILDFSPEDDTILLRGFAFGEAGDNGILAPGAFRTGAAAQDATDRIIYRRSTGQIFYDADGSGAADAVLFAEVDPGVPLTYQDFVIYGGG